MSFARAARHPGLRAALAAALAGAALATAAAAEDLPLDPDCLSVSQSSPATYVIENAACPTLSVLAAIELAGSGAAARCFTKKIRSQISIASEHAPPVITYQCVEGAPGCSIAEVRGMFPECHAG